MARHAKESKLLREIGLAPDSSFEFGTIVERRFEELVRSKATRRAPSTKCQTR